MQITSKNTIAKFCLSAHNLLIETIPHKHIVRNQGICSMCTLNEVEDEYHFLLICKIIDKFKNFIKIYDKLRHMYF